MATTVLQSDVLRPYETVGSVSISPLYALIQGVRPLNSRNHLYHVYSPDRKSTLLCVERRGVLALLILAFS